MGFTTNIINIAEFEEEPTIKDDLDQYKSIVKKYHPRVLMTIIIGEDRKNINCYADEQDIDNMIKSLIFTKKQLESVIQDNIKRI